MLALSFRWRFAVALLACVAQACGKVGHNEGLPGSASAGTVAASAAGTDSSSSTGGLSTGGSSFGGSSSASSGGTEPGQAGCGDLIDDLESGSGHICSGNGRVGVWYAFNDNSGEQWPALTTAGVPIPTSSIPGGRGKSTRAIHTYGTGFVSWGVGVGLDFNFDGVNYGSFDASELDGISFWARSDTPQRLLSRIGTRATTVAAYGGTCREEPCGPHGLEVAVNASWAEYKLAFKDLRQTGYWREPAEFLRNELTNLQFMPRSQPFDFWIDDVRFYRDADCCSQPPAGCAGVVDFPDAALEERVRRTVGKPQGELHCEDLCDAPVLVRSGLAEPDKIRDLSGLQCLLGLSQLELASNRIEELSPLSGLTHLHSLVLDDNPISDATALAGLPFLETLSLRKIGLTSLNGLGDLPSLTRLLVDDNLLSDVSPAAELRSLTSFGADRNQLVDVRALSALPLLQALSVESNPLQDLSQFLEFPRLTSVDLAGSPASCTAEEDSVVAALLARGVSVAHGSVSAACMQ
jgi:hypothetical protein